jgi:hypothetical protein
MSDFSCRFLKLWIWFGKRYRACQVFSYGFRAEVLLSCLAFGLLVVSRPLLGLSLTKIQSGWWTGRVLNPALAIRSIKEAITPHRQVSLILDFYSFV